MDETTPLSQSTPLTLNGAGVEGGVYLSNIVEWSRNTEGLADHTLVFTGLDFTSVHYKHSVRYMFCFEILEHSLGIKMEEN